MTEIKQRVFQEIDALIDDDSVEVVDELQLIGDNSALDSMKLVSLCIALEDLAGEIGFEFDWTSDAAMSKTRSMFRTAGSLFQEFDSQRSAQQ